MSVITYPKDLLLGLYSLARNYYLCGFFEEAEQICTGIIIIDDKITPVRLLNAAINLEQGNYSLAANHFRIASQDPKYFNQSRVGILSCYIGQKDMARAHSLSQELNKELHSFAPELKAFYDTQLQAQTAK